jgi:hypothetical protein
MRPQKKQKPDALTVADLEAIALALKWAEYAPPDDGETYPDFEALRFKVLRLRDRLRATS